MTQKTLTLDGQRIAHAGRLLRVSWDADLQGEVEAQGAELMSSISDKVTLFVAGVQPGSKKTKAMTRGATIITEAEFEHLLEHGEITVQTRASVDRDLSLDDVLGEVRSLLGQPAQNASWSAMLGYLERCDEPELPVLVDYIAPHLETWGRRKRWQTSAKNPLFAEFYPKYWHTGMPQAHMCVAPPIWMLEALRGEHSVRHRLARSLNLEGMQLNGRLAERILDHPEWKQIQAINLGIQNRFSKGFWKTLATHPICAQIEELWMYAHPVGLFDGEWADTSIFPELKLLKCIFPEVRWRTVRTKQAIEQMREESGWIREDVIIKEMTY